MSNDCITIDSSDSDDVQITDKKGPSESIHPESAKKRIKLQTLNKDTSFDIFLKMCKEVDQSSDTDLAIQKLKKRYERADSAYTSSMNFLNLIETALKLVAREPWTQMRNVSEELKFHVKPKCKSIIDDMLYSADANAIELDVKRSNKIAKLEKVLSKLKSQIVKLEEEEVDNDDENSAYIKASRYKEGLCQVHRKICELRGTPHIGAMEYLRFIGTKIPVVNRAIEKFYNEHKMFPDYPDILKVVTVANQKKNLGFLHHQVEEIAKRAFTELGKDLKHKRQIEICNHFDSYITEVEHNPAVLDEALERKLLENEKLYGSRINEIIDKYANLQSQNSMEPVEVHSDTASSDKDDNEEEEEEDTPVMPPSEYQIDDDLPECDDEFRADSDFPACKVCLPDFAKLSNFGDVKLSASALNLLGKNSKTISQFEMDEPCCKSLTSDSFIIHHKRGHSFNGASEASKLKRCKITINKVNELNKKLSIPTKCIEDKISLDSSDEDAKITVSSEKQNQSTLLKVREQPSSVNSSEILLISDEIEERMYEKAVVKKISESENLAEEIPNIKHDHSYDNSKNKKAERLQITIEPRMSITEDFSSMKNYSMESNEITIKLPTLTDERTNKKSPLNQSLGVDHVTNKHANSEKPRDEKIDASKIENCSTLNDDEVVIIDERSNDKLTSDEEVIDVQKEHTERKPFEEEIIDIDKLADSAPSSSSGSSGIDLTAFIRQRSVNLQKYISRPTLVSIPKSATTSAQVCRFPLTNCRDIRPSINRFPNSTNNLTNIYGSKAGTVSNVVSRYRPTVPRPLFNVNRSRSNQRIDMNRNSNSTSSWRQRSCPTTQTMQKRTTQTNEYRSIHSNNRILTQRRTITVVEESMQLSQSRSSTPNNLMSQMNDPSVRDSLHARTIIRREIRQHSLCTQQRKPSRLGNEEVITLD